RAATEMRDRIHKLVGPEATRCWLGTFHAVCARILRQDGEPVGLPRDFVVFDDADQLAVVREVLTELNLDGETYKPRMVLSQISHAKEEMLSPAEFEANATHASDHTIARVYRLYQERLRKNHAADFDDLILLAVRLFDSHPEVLEYYQSRFQHVMIDEYQDINRVQYELVTRLAAGHRNLCVVGDDDQSVYAWRGADIRFILAFEEDYADARILKLEQNYRSTQTILDAAHSVVSRNRGRREKRLWTERGEGELLRFHQAEDETAEARTIAQCLEDEVDGVRLRHQDCAILYRTNAQSRVLEDVLRRRRIPYRIVGGVRFYDRKEVKDLLCYLRLLQNGADDLALKRVINAPTRGIGEKSVERLEEFARIENLTLFEAMRRADRVEGLTSRGRAALAQFTRTIALLAAARDGLNVTGLLQELIAQTGYRRVLEAERTLEAQERIANVDELVHVTQEFDNQVGGTLAEFLEHMALMSDVDTLKAGADSVVLMTLHAAKGLEFPWVCVAGMEEDVFPHIRSRDSQSELEEERRLCYVGITRAERRLLLTCARRRTIFGQTRIQNPSRFLREIPEECFTPGQSPGELERRDRYADVDGLDFPRGNSRLLGVRPRPPAAGPAPATRPAGPDRTGLEELRRQTLAGRAQEKGRFAPGDRVRHSVFGEGIVLRSSGSGDDEEVRIIFPSVGEKRLIVGYAPLEKLQ
ncbi:MAG: ATP-dependent DNA helicase PcrA, partial [Armatimonadetes bacterium]|nr:ATP-dependent DNA helicase PcrA [Armatimonadota bacterium]